MHVLAIMGSYRKGRTIDTLMDRAIEGAQARGGVHVDKIVLAEAHIEYCRNCMACRNDDSDRPWAPCAITDDMDALFPVIARADRYIFGTPVNMGHETAVMKTFLERVCWVFARPGRWPVSGCPTPRDRRRKKAVVICSSGIISPPLRRFCDSATPLIKGVCRDSLSAQLVGSLYAGAVERRGVEQYLKRAYSLGQRLCS